MIRNPDGSAYRLQGKISQFDTTGRNADLFNRFDEPLFRLYGSPVYYYEVLIDLTTVDRIHLEDRGKLFSPVPIQLWGLYEPAIDENISNEYILDVPNTEIIIEFNYRAILAAIGHPPKVGSRIFTPHRGENWIIIERRAAQFRGWQVLHMELLCKRFQETTTTGEGNVSQPEPDYKVNG